jgi:hypothetical protein
MNIRFDPRIPNTAVRNGKNRSPLNQIKSKEFFLALVPGSAFFPTNPGKHLVFISD